MTDADTDTDIDEESTLDMDELASTVVDHMDPGKYGDKWVLSRRQMVALAGGGLSVGALASLGVSDAQAQTAVGTIGTASSPVDVEAASINTSQSITENGQDVISSPDDDYEIQKDGTDGTGVINFKTQ